MRFRNRENQLMWERYVDPYSQLEMGGDEPLDDPTLDDPILGEEDFESEPEVSVMSFETGDEVDSFEGCNEVVYSDIKKLAEYSQRILDICKETEFEPWMQAKLVKASDYVSDIWNRLDAEADFANTGFEQSDNISF
jgi:hypothetical protein